MLRSLLLVLTLVFSLRGQATPTYDFTPVAAQMQQLLQTHALVGASLRVNKYGAVAYQQSFGSYDANTRIRIASATKWISALTIARLVDKGQMRWKDTVGQYFPQVSADKAGITLEQLFSHTSGLPYEDDVCLSNPAYTLASCANRILQRPLIGTPGMVFAYGGNSMQVAGRMAELATGKAWDDIFIDEMAIPLGLTAIDWATTSTAAGYVRNANPRIAGGARSTLGDYGLLMDMVLARGMHAGQPFLSTQTLDEMARDRTRGTTDLARPTPTPAAATYGYGIGQWIEKTSSRRYLSGAPTLSSPGAFGFTPWIDHLNGIAGIVMVQDQLPAVAADIDEIRASVQVVTTAPPLPCAGTNRTKPACQAPKTQANAQTKAMPVH